MTITQVLYALETARCQNVSKAAERMFVSQPALPAQLGKLEEELGCKLFRRGHQGVSLTAAGVSFCQTAEAVEAAWRELQESTRNLQNAVCRQIRIGMGPRALSNGLVDALLSFFDQHPETEVSFITDNGEDMLTALEEGRTELAVRIGYWSQEHGQTQVEEALARIREERDLLERPMWPVLYYPAGGPVGLIEFLLDQEVLPEEEEQAVDGQAELEGEPQEETAENGEKIDSEG